MEYGCIRLLSRPQPKAQGGHIVFIFLVSNIQNLSRIGVQSCSHIDLEKVMDMFWFGAIGMFMIAILAWQLGSLKDRISALENKNDTSADTDYLT
jgi:hypothetical protein